MNAMQNVTIPYERQSEPETGRTCGSACLSMVYRSLGKEIPQMQIWPSIAKPNRAGNLASTTHLMAQDALTRGFSAIAVQVRYPLQALRICRNSGIRAILNHRLQQDAPTGHYTVMVDLDDKNVVLRMKDDNDSAEPAASSVAAFNLLRLSQFRDDPAAAGAERARKTIDAFAATLSHFPSAMPQMLVAIDYSLIKPRQIVIAGKKDSPGTKAILREVHRHFLSDTILLLADGAEGQKYLGDKNEAIRAMSMVDGKSAAYVCENFTCKAPVTDPKALSELLTR